MSLDNLVKKIADADQVESALISISLFNKDTAFYPGYARNYISKSVLNNADGDPRVGYIKQACTLVGSTQSILEGGQGLVEKEAQAEAVKRVKKAQELISKFLTESNVTDDKITAFAKYHPSN